MHFSLGSVFSRFSPEVEATLRWISTIATADDVVCIELEKGSIFYRYRFPLRPGSLPHQTGEGKEKETFIVSAHRARDWTREGWRSVFSSPSLEVLESNTRQFRILPLRFKLAHKERAELIALIREALARAIRAGTTLPIPAKMSERLYLKADVDVSLWVDGCLRGSRIIFGYELWRSATEAAFYASRDSRFKPLTEGDLSSVVVEVTILGDLRIPLTEVVVARNEIYPDKAYCAVTADASGWLIPDIFNVRKIRDLCALFQILVEEKLGRTTAKPSFFMCETDAFVSYPTGSSYAMRASMPEVNSLPLHKQVRGMCEGAVIWLTSIQQEDGHIPPIISPWRLTSPAIDWPRLAFVSGVLVRYGHAAKSERAEEGGRRAFEFLRSSLFRGAADTGPLFLAYLGMAALEYGDGTLARRIGDDLMNREPVGDPITRSQVTSFLRALGSTPSVAVQKNLAHLKDLFVREKDICPPYALFAELAVLFAKDDPLFAGEVSEWLRSSVLPTGACIDRPGSSFIYTRGTAKIFEVLAAGTEDEKLLTRIAQWLAHMQYRDDAEFFIPKERRELLRGAFRHDYQNADAWIDSAGHVLLAGARMLGTTSHA